MLKAITIAPANEVSALSPEDAIKVGIMIDELEHIYLRISDSRLFSYKKERAVFAAIAALAALRKNV